MNEKSTIGWWLIEHLMWKEMKLLEKIQDDRPRYFCNHCVMSNKDVFHEDLEETHMCFLRVYNIVDYQLPTD